MTVRVVAWIAEDTWPACVAAVREHAGPTADVLLVGVVDEELVDRAGGAWAGLLGRGRPPAADAPARVVEAGVRAALAEAEVALAAPVRTRVLRGRAERELVAAADGADLVILVRDGDPRPGPHSLGRVGRYVVDHLTCPVLVVPAE